MRTLLLLLAGCARAVPDPVDTDEIDPVDSDPVDSDPVDSEPPATTLRGATGDGDLVDVEVSGRVLTLRIVGSPRGRALTLTTTVSEPVDGLRTADDPRVGALVLRDDLVAGFLTLDDVPTLFVTTVEGRAGDPLEGDWAYVDRWCDDPLPCGPPLEVTIGSFRLAADGRWGDCKEGFTGPDVDDCPVGVTTGGAWSWDEDGRLSLAVGEAGATVGRGFLSATTGLLVGGIPDQPEADQGPGLFLGLPSVAGVDLDGSWITLRSDGTTGRLVIDGDGFRDGDTTGALRRGVPYAGWITLGEGTGPLLVGSAAGLIVRTDAPDGQGWMELGVRDDAAR